MNAGRRATDRRSASASAFSNVPYAASCTVQGSESTRRVGGGTGAAATGGGGGEGGATCVASLRRARKDSPAVASNTQPPAAPASTLNTTPADARLHLGAPPP